MEFELRLCWIVATALCMAPLTLSQNCANFTTLRPENTVAAEGSRACLHCDYPDRDNEQWERDGTVIRTGDATNPCDCEPSTGVQPVELCFNSVSDSDTGDYTCVEQLNFGSTLRCTVTLSLADAPQITNKPSNPNITLPIDATRTITVTFSQGSPPATVEWRKDGQLINDQRVSTSNTETSLMLTNSAPEVRGRYNVTVFNVGGSDSFVYNVKAEFAPVINLTHSLISNGYRLTCVALGYPRLDVTWETVDGRNAISGSNDIICETESRSFDFCLTSTLDIESHSCDTNGYRCSVSNSQRTSSQSVSVCPNQPPPTPNSITVTVLNSTAVTVSWEVIATPVVDNYIIDYRLEGTTDWNQMMSPGPSLIIPNLMQGMRYEFRVASKNDFGTSDFSNIQTTSPCSSGRPPVVTGVDASLSVGSTMRVIRIQWQQSQDQGVSGYRIYISPPESSPININRVDSTSYEFRPPSCSGGTVYTFTVQAVNSCGSGGPNSSQVQRECFLPNRIRIREIVPYGSGIMVIWESDQQDLLSPPLRLEIRDISSLSDGQPVIRIYQIDVLTTSTFCVGGLTSRTTYNVCLNASYSDRPSFIEVDCEFTTTVDQDPAHINTEQCLTPNEIIGTQIGEPTTIFIPDWAIAVIVVGVLAIVALVFCFLGLCFACRTSNQKGGAEFGSTSSIQTNSIRDGPIRNHRQMSPSRSCLSYHAKGHSTNWNDHVDTLRQMDTGGTAV